MSCKSLILRRLHSWDLDCRRHWTVFSEVRVLGHLYVYTVSAKTFEPNISVIFQGIFVQI
jgi:hypothetical protein